MTERLLKVLHVGCGPHNPHKLPAIFQTPDWQEVRLDINSAVHPDIVASVTDMANVESGSFDAIWSSHNLEHLYPYEVPIALGEFARVLNEQGFLLLTLPDLQLIAEHIAQGRLLEVAYMSSAGPISPIDMLFGFRPDLAAGNHYMAHRTGFTAESLQLALNEASFAATAVRRDIRTFALWAVASKTDLDQAAAGNLIDILLANDESGGGGEAAQVSYG